MAHFLGIDAGTTTVSAVLFDHREGRAISAATVPHSAYTKGPPGHREQDLRVVLDAVGRAVSGVIEATDASVSGIDGVSVTGQMHGFAFLDEAAKPIGPFITWEDRRAAGRVPASIADSTPVPDDSPIMDDAPIAGASPVADDTWLGLFRRRFASCMDPAEGVTVAPGFASVNLFVLKETTGIPERARWVVSIQDWLVATLTGSMRLLTDASCAQSTGCFLPRTGRWNRELIEAIGIDAMMLPDVVAPGTRAGKTHGSVCGLIDGTPVFVGMGDNQASFLAAVRDPASEMLVTIGTGSQVSAAVEQFTLVKGLDTRPFAEARYLLVGAPLCGGRAYAMLHEFFAEVGRRYFDASLDADELYRRMERETSFDTDMRCRTTFAGTRVDPDLTGAIEYIGTMDLEPGRLTGCLLKGIAEELFDMYRSMGIYRPRFVATGNAVRRNPPLRRALEEVFGTTAGSTEFVEEAAVGAALLAGVGLGRYDGFGGVWAQ